MEPNCVALFFVFAFVMQMFSIASYNCHGLGAGRLDYIQELCNEHDFVLLQEHWLLNDKIPEISNKLNNVVIHGISGMVDSEPLIGRPYGGCAILWRKDIPFNITPVYTGSKRLCAVKLTGINTNILLFNVYMPCDTLSNSEEYESVLSDVNDTANNNNVTRIIIGGDFNTDFQRKRSSHTKSLSTFMKDECIECPDENIEEGFSHTFESKSDGTRSNIDHFLLTNNLHVNVVKYKVIHDGHNLSDHCPISISLSLTGEQDRVLQALPLKQGTRLSWDKTTEDNVKAYQCELNNLLAQIHVPVDTVICDNLQCKDHQEEIQMYYDNIMNSCLIAGDKCIPHCKQGNGQYKHVPGWSEFVKEHKDKAIFWHAIWRSSGSPREGTVADIRRRTRAKFHYALRYVKRYEDVLRANKLADALQEDRSRDFWKEVKKSMSSKTVVPNNIDTACGDEEIGNLFADKAKCLYNSVSYSKLNMKHILDCIDDDVNKQCASDNCYHKHVFTPNDIFDAISCVKKGKSDGTGDLSSDYLIHGSHSLRVHLGLLFTSILRHGIFPTDFVLSTIIPIPKSSRKSLNNSENYRGIALSSIVGKVFDHVLLNSNNKIFACSDSQYGFKKKHSTVQCTFVVNEVIQYYVNGGGSVHAMLLDASKAFDRVQYEKLFSVLRDKGICPLIARILANMYMSQKVQVKWNNYVSDVCAVSNGVKQGGVISPILFVNYVDELFLRLKKLGIGCYVGNIFCGAFGYADDVILLAPTRRSLKVLLAKCLAFAKEYSLLFNAGKSKYLIFNNLIAECHGSIEFDGTIINNVESEVHLGNIIGNRTNRDKITSSVSDFNRRFNVLQSSFKHIDVSVKYVLFKTHCMPLFGCQLWDFSSSDCHKYYTAWRKSIRRLCAVNYRTHNHLLHYMCHDIPVDAQLHKRFLKFFHTAVNSSNVYTSLCARLALDGSNSSVSNSLTFITNKYKLAKYQLTSLSVYKVLNHVMPVNNVTHASTAGAILDFIQLRDDSSINVEDKFGVNDILLELCTS